jgi:hypothetical protein
VVVDREVVGLAHQRLDDGDGERPVPKIQTVAPGFEMNDDVVVG